ncbi:MAG: sensor domain-containing diguanylate cyclase [Stagnimonas sp.]|nr:sensor domain-containing diguanylate cyclase [Stagnimonas sp.]
MTYSQGLDADEPARRRQRVVDDLYLTTQRDNLAFERLVRLLANHTGMPLANLSLLGVAAETRLASFGGNPSLAASQFLTSRVVTRERLQVLADCRPLLPANGRRGAPRFYAGLPVNSPGGEVVGALSVQDRHPRRFTPWQRRALADFGQLVENELRLRSVAVRDHLTGLYNRRFFDELGDREWRRSKRDAFPLSVLMVDIDYFKNYNDTYGHVAGDQVLAQVAGCLRGTFRRAADFLARYGGEEFAAVLPSTDHAGGLRAGQRLCEGIEQLAIPHRGAPRGLVTVSIGVSTADAKAPADANLQDHLAAADAALYRAKQAGRATVISASFD